MNLQFDLDWKVQLKTPWAWGCSIMVSAKDVSPNVSVTVVVAHGLTYSDLNN